MTAARVLPRFAAAAAGLALLAGGLSMSGSTEAAPSAHLEQPAGIALASSTTSFEKQVLKLVNKARAKKRVCGTTTYKAAKALKWNSKLALAAERHSKDMSKKDYFSHTGANGSSPFSRIKATGYKYKAAGETIAAGYSTPSAVVNAWLKSPGHCKILMSKSYTQLGVGYYKGSGTYRHYTTAAFAKPR